MILNRASAAGRRLLQQQQQQHLQRGLATLPTPKFFDYQASSWFVPCGWAWMCASVCACVGTRERVDCAIGRVDRSSGRAVDSDP
jgi:hypothetical protein